MWVSSKVVLCPATMLEYTDIFAETRVIVSISTKVTRLNKLPFIAIPYDITIGWLRRIKDDFTVAEGMTGLADVGHDAVSVPNTYPVTRFYFRALSHDFTQLVARA
jgi:hypothetical protein